MRLAAALVLLTALGLASPAHGALPRATSDRPDDRVGPQVHVLYVVPQDGADRALDTSGTVGASVQGFQDWLRRETGGRALNADTYQGELDVTFFRLATSDAAVAARGPYVREQVEEELFAAGFDSPTKVYAVYYDGGSTWSCGGGDPQPEFRGTFAAMYLRGTPPGASCASQPIGLAAPGYFEFGMLHEIVHSLGFVQACAPNARRDYVFGHVSDSRYDLMWSGPEPWGTNEPDSMRLDIGRDDYYGHGRTDCPDLATSPYLAGAPQLALALDLAGRGRGRVEIASRYTGQTTSCEADCTSSFLWGDELTLKAVPARGSSFAGWDGCSGFPAPAVCTVTLKQAASVTARFLPRRYRFTLSTFGPGRVTCSPRCGRFVEHGTRLALRAVPRPGARFLGWSGACRGTKPTCRVKIERATAVRARFS